MAEHRAGMKDFRAIVASVLYHHTSFLIYSKPYREGCMFPALLPFSKTRPFATDVFIPSRPTTRNPALHTCAFIPQISENTSQERCMYFDFLFSFLNRSVEPAMSSVLPSPPQITIGHSVSLLYMLSKNLNFSACVSLFLAPSKTRTKKDG
jgi:hypothetical protein